MRIFLSFGILRSRNIPFLTHVCPSSHWIPELINVLRINLTAQVFQQSEIFASQRIYATTHPQDVHSPARILDKGGLYYTPSSVPTTRFNQSLRSDIPSHLSHLKDFLGKDSEDELPDAWQGQASLPRGVDYPAFIGKDQKTGRIRINIGPLIPPQNHPDPDLLTAFFRDQIIALS